MYTNITNNTVKTSIDALTEKSIIVTVSGNESEQNFSEFISKAYHDLQLSFDGRTELFMGIVAKNANSKIYFLTNQDDILKNELDDGTKCSYIKLDDIAHLKRDIIYIDTNRNYEDSNYRKFLGDIAHAFCHFALNEIFGHEMKPYYDYENDGENSEKWKKLLTDYHDEICLSKFPIIKKTFDKYPEYEWVDELFVRYVQFHVEHDNEDEKLQEFHETFVELSKMCNFLEKQFNSEYIKICALRYVNERTLLGDKKSKIYANTLETFFEIDLESHRQVIKTNQTYLMMKNIYKKVQKHYKFESEYMFIDVSFLELDYHFDLIETALQCRNVANLIVDCHHDAYVNTSIREKLWHLFNCHHIGRIVLIMHESQDFEFNNSCQSINFNASHLTREFKGSLKVYFQGSQQKLLNLIDPDLIIGSITTLFDGKVYETFTSKEISIGNQQNFKTDKIPRYYVNRKYRQKTLSGWSDEINLDNGNCLREVFEKNRCVLIMNETGEGKTVESCKMYKRMKAAYPKFWIVHVNLPDHVKALSKLSDKDLNHMEIFSHDIMHFEAIELEVFEIFFKAGHVVFIFDGLDEICNKLMVDKIEKLIVQFACTNNKMCIFTRPFVIKGFNVIKENFLEFQITEISYLNKQDLVKQILEFKKVKKSVKYDALLKKIFNFLDLSEMNNDDTESHVKYKHVRNLSNLNSPQAIKLVTEVLSSLPETINNFVLTRYDIYHKYVKNISEELNILKLTDHEKSHGIMTIIEYSCRIALENIISSKVFFKCKFSFNEKYNKEQCRRDLEEFRNEFFPFSIDNNIIFPLIKSGFLIRNDDSSYRFEHSSFEVHFIAHFMRSNCEKLCNNKNFLNIFCYIATKLEQTDRLEFLIEELQGCSKVVKCFSTLEVFKKIFDGNSMTDKTSINIDPILIELCKTEPTFSKRFLTRFSDPLSEMKQIEKLRLSVFAECGEHSSTGYYITLHDFKRIFARCIFIRMKNPFLSRIVGSTGMIDSFYDELTLSLRNLSLFKHKSVIKLFLELHEHHLSDENYRNKHHLNDDLIKLLLNKNVDGEMFSMLKNVLIEFCYHSKITMDDLFNSDKSFFSKSPLELLLDCEFVYDEYLTVSSLAFLMNLVESEENFIGSLISNNFVKCFAIALIGYPNNFYTMKVKTILAFILGNFNIENSKKAFLFKRHNVSIQPMFDSYLDKSRFYDIQMCADEYRFNIIQLALLDNFKSPSKCFFEELSKEFMTAISNDAKFAIVLRKEIFTDEFLRILCKLICGDFFVKSKTLKIVKHLNDAQYIGRFLYFIDKFEKIESLECFLDIILAVTGDENFVNFMLSYELLPRSFIMQSPSIEHVDAILKILTDCDGLRRNVRNIPKLLGLLNVNEILSDEEIQLLIEKHKLVVGIS